MIEHNRPGIDRCYYCRRKCSDCTAGTPELSRCCGCKKLMYVEAPFAHSHKTEGHRLFDICQDCLLATAHAVENFYLHPKLLPHLSEKLGRPITQEYVRDVFNFLYDLREITSRAKQQ